MAGFFGNSNDEDDNPGGNPNTDASDLHADDEAQEQAARDYDQQVGSDEHEAEVAAAREGAGFDDPPTEEE
jgi:hypothetical protein